GLFRLRIAGGKRDQRDGGGNEEKGLHSVATPYPRRGYRQGGKTDSRQYLCPKCLVLPRNHARNPASASHCGCLSSIFTVWSGLDEGSATSARSRPASSGRPSRSAVPPLN